MTELEKFDQVWNKHFHTKQWQATLDNFQDSIADSCLTEKGRLTKERYEKILFSIWKHHTKHRDQKWEGFQIKCQDRTVYRVLELAEEAGLLIKTGNYSVGRFTRQYKKNHTLFDAVFRNQENRYGAWLNNFNSANQSKEQDIIHYFLITELQNINITRGQHYVAPNYGATSRKYKNLNYDLGKLHILSKTMWPYYYNLLETLNNNVCHPDFKMFSWLKFDQDHLPTGRPYSYFCSSLNRNKKHEVIDPSMEYRDDFLKNRGLSDYYEVYDIKSEVPRVNYLFHSGEWKDDDFDFYKEIIDDYSINMPDEDRISRGKAGSPNYDDSMKQIFMRIYFGTGSEKQSFLGYKEGYEKRNKELFDLVKNGFDLDYNGKIIKYKPDFLTDDELFPYTLDEWYELSCSIEKIIGQSIGPLIFWYTFFLETEVRIELLNRGKVVYNVYDGFYYNKDIADEIKIILEQKSKFIYDNYMLPIQK